MRCYTRSGVVNVVRGIIIIKGWKVGNIYKMKVSMVEVELEDSSSPFSGRSGSC